MMLKRKDILDLEIRRTIYKYITNNPGLHLRKISRKTNIPKTTLEYHLRYLEKEGLIISNPEENYIRYYATDKVGNMDKKILNILRQETPRRIILFVFLYPYYSRVVISKEVDKPVTTVSFHLKKLVDMNIIEPYQINRRTVYRLKSQIFMYHLLVKYEKSLSEDIFVFHLLNYVRHIIPDGVPKRIDKKDGNDDSAIDEISEYFYEIFPHPYHV